MNPRSSRWGHAVLERILPNLKTERVLQCNDANHGEATHGMADSIAGFYNKVSDPLDAAVVAVTQPTAASGKWQPASVDTSEKTMPTTYTGTNERRAQSPWTLRETSRYQ